VISDTHSLFTPLFLVFVGNWDCGCSVDVGFGCIMFCLFTFISDHISGTNIHVSIKIPWGRGGATDPESAGLGLKRGVFCLFSADLDIWGQVWANF